MRIIAGKFKGHKLVSFSEDHIRPMTDRVKESLFNIWAPWLEQARVLDLYSGTGSVGLEALSRGCEFVQFVDNHKRSILLIQKNVMKLGVESSVAISKIEVLDYLKEFQGPGFDLIFIDPPFPALIGDATMAALVQSPSVNEGTRIVIEHSKKEKLASEYGSFRAVDTRSYGDKILSFYGKN